MSWEVHTGRVEEGGVDGEDMRMTDEDRRAIGYMVCGYPDSLRLGGRRQISITLLVGYLVCLRLGRWLRRDLAVRRDEKAAGLVV